MPPSFHSCCTAFRARAFAAAVGILLTFAPWAGSASGQGWSNIPAAFADVGISARAAGMGYAGVSLARGADALAWNTAGIGAMDRAEILFSYVDQMELVAFEHASVSVPFGRDRWGAAMSATATGDDALREYTAAAGLSWRYRWIRLGVGGRYRRAVFGRNALGAGDYEVFDPDEIAEGIQRQVNGTAHGWGIDAGLLLRPLDDFFMSASLHNLTAPVRWTSNSAARQGASTYIEHVPTELTLGMAYVRDRGSVAMDWSPALFEDVADRVALGVEFRPIDAFGLRVGRHMIGDGAPNEAVTLGFGVDFPELLGIDLTADYAYVTGELSRTQQFTLRMNL